MLRDNLFILQDDCTCISIQHNIILPLSHYYDNYNFYGVLHCMIELLSSIYCLGKYKMAKKL